MSFAVLKPRYRHWKAGGQTPPPYNVWNGIHSVRLVGQLWLTIRPRSLRYTSVGPWIYALHGVVDVGIHFGVVSIGLKYQRPMKRPARSITKNILAAFRRAS